MFRTRKGNGSHSDDGLLAEAVAGGRVMANVSRRLLDIEGGVLELQAEARRAQRPGRLFARAARAVASAKEMSQRQLGTHISPAEYAADILKDHKLAAVLSANTTSEGGALLQAELAEDFFQALTSRSIVRRRCRNQYDMPGGNFGINGVSQNALAAWADMPSQVAIGDMTLRQARMMAKKVIAWIPVSNLILRYGGPRAEASIAESLIRACAHAENSAFLRGPGTQYQPKGLKNWSANRFNAQATPDLTKVTQDLGLAISRLGDADSDLAEAAWAISPKTFAYLGNLRGSGGAKAFPELDAGLLRGLPYDLTSVIPNNLGVGGDESEIYLVDYSGVALGDSLRFEVRTSDQSFYFDGAQNVSAFDKDETVVQAIHETDISAPQPEVIAVIEAAAWTP